MKSLLTAATFLTLSAVVQAAPTTNTVTVYSAPGLHDGAASWFEREFADFTRQTGIEVNYVQEGAGGIIDRAEREKDRVDVIITLPPFIQKAKADGLLQPYTPKNSYSVTGGNIYYTPIARNYLSYIYSGASLTTPPATYKSLLNPKFKGKIQYSTPGEAGDGTAMMLQVFHAFGSKEAGFNYLRQLQANNVGPSPATGPLTSLVNSSTLYVANGDLQMNLAQQAANPNIRIFWPSDASGQRSALSMSYYAALGVDARHPDAGKTLIDFLLSEKAQQAVGGEPVRKDVKRTDAGYLKWKASLQGVTLWEPDWTQVLHDLPADLVRWHAATGT